MKVGDQVIKHKGYPYPGEVRSVFTTKAGLTRVVVESQLAPGMLHIFNQDQVGVVDPGEASRQIIWKKWLRR